MTRGKKGAPSRTTAKAPAPRRTATARPPSRAGAKRTRGATPAAAGAAGAAGAPATPAAAVDPRFERVVAAFAGDRSVVKRRMFSSENVLAVGGKIFAMLTRGALVVKLPRDRVDQLVRDGIGDRFDPGHGRVMKEWVVIGAGGPDWTDIAREARAFVRDGAR